MLYFTTSWDDGAPEDIRLSDLLLTHGIKGTFYIPIRNSEGREVISEKLIVSLSQNFEIGAHTINHRYLTTISEKDAAYEIRESKIALEQILGKKVQGFCFPGGKYKSNHIQMVKDNDFAYARTVNMFSHQYDTELMNTSLQAFDHSRFTYCKHLMKRGYFSKALSHAGLIFSTSNWDGLLKGIIEKELANDKPDKNTVIHLWGHSWEIAENDSWKQLETFFEFIREQQIKTISNYEVASITGNFLTTYA